MDKNGNWKVCLKENCGQPRTKRGYCAQHQPPAYINSEHSTLLPPNWNQIRKDILQRDRNVCYKCYLPTAQEVDHIIPLKEGGSNNYHNLASICIPCHRKKTSQEGHKAKKRNKNSPNMWVQQYLQ